MVKHRLCWVLCLGIAGCGGETPTEPSPGAPGLPGQTVPQFATGRYALTMLGPNFSADSPLAACSEALSLPPVPRSVSFQLTVTKEGAEWVGRTSGAAADVEVRFRDTEDAGELAFGGRAFVGTIRGQGTDQGISGLIGSGVSVTFAGTGATAALLDARTAVPFSTSMLLGRAVGAIRFRDPAGNVATCPAVSVSMNVLN